MSPPVLLFDLDGTLTDSRLGIVRCMRYALERLAAPCPSDEALAVHIGGSLRTTFATLLAAPDPPLVERALTLYRERYAGIGLYENEVYPGIPEALERLAGQARLMVATQKDTRYAETIVEHFGLTRYLAGVYGTDFDGRLDDKREVIAHLLTAERAAPAEALMIGDRAHDVLAARVNGVRTLGVLWGYGSREELVDAGADALCESPAGLAACLAQLR
ncbi:MAG TPA: HAD hydrolase-like protein [Methylomirabilota bacterium]|jgi:phosphoglycolate phosphatase